MRRPETAPDDNKAFEPDSFHLIEKKFNGVKWRVRSSLAPAELDAVLANPDSIFVNQENLLADSPLITMARIPGSVGEAGLLLRRLNYGRASHRLRDLFRPTRAERAFWSGIGLERAGVATARSVAVGVDRLCRWPRRAYLITEYLSPATTLETRLAVEKGLPREDLIRLADLLASLHRHGFSHRDLKSSNLLFTETHQPHLIDLDGVRHFRSLNERRAVADLSRFAWEFRKCPQFVKWNAARFLKRYCAQRGQGDFRKLAMKIAEPVNRRLKAGIDFWKK